MNQASSTLVHDRVCIELTDEMLSDGVADLRNQLREIVLAGARLIVVDVSRVGQLQSTAVAAMLNAHRACRARGGGIVLRDPNRRTLDHLQRTGLWRVLRLEFSRDTQAAVGPR